MQLSLASLAAPKLGRAPGIADEQFAWDSREFLRKKCIGKQVKKVLFNVPPPAVSCPLLPRAAGDFTLPSTPPTDSFFAPFLSFRE